MGTTRRLAAAGSLLLALGLTAACEAPLKPESQRSPAAPASTAPPSTPVEPAPSGVAPPPDAGSPIAPSITVPTLSVPPLSVPPLDTPRPGAPGGGIIEGADASWPQCPKGMGIPQKRSEGAPMPLDTARFVVLGLTNGPGFTPNPCLADQVEWVRSRKLMIAAYAVISQPDAEAVRRHGSAGPFDKDTRLGRLANTGYQQSVFNLSTMRRAGLPTPVVWLDVEPVPSFDWGSDLEANAAVVRGAARGYTDAGLRIGAYSTQALWARVVGDLRLGIPEWRAAGQTSRAEALRRCGADRMFQGGQPVMSQWVEFGRDRNVTCPGISAQMQRWFHQF